jgi:hypothetical protein
MTRFILYAILIYIVYLLIKWAFRYGSISAKLKNGRRKTEKKKSKIDPENIEDADYTEVKEE